MMMTLKWSYGTTTYCTVVEGVVQEERGREIAWMIFAANVVVVTVVSFLFRLTLPLVQPALEYSKKPFRLSSSSSFSEYLFTAGWHSWQPKRNFWREREKGRKFPSSEAN